MKNTHVDNIVILPQYLLDKRNEMIIEMRSKGYSFQNIADVFGMTKSEIYRIAKVENETEENE